MYKENKDAKDRLEREKNKTRKSVRRSEHLMKN